mmetsp:Transcript_145144/g.253312  ORF Transcript_145144/g.253312 Transcript_145144/m.253312 type:complete len:239 (+) Transcript_145144:66-782(+)
MTWWGIMLLVLDIGTALLVGSYQLVDQIGNFLRVIIILFVFLTSLILFGFLLFPGLPVFLVFLVLLILFLFLLGPFCGCFPFLFLFLLLLVLLFLFVLFVFLVLFAISLLLFLLLLFFLTLLFFFLLLFLVVILITPLLFVCRFICTSTQCSFEGGVCAGGLESRIHRVVKIIWWCRRLGGLIRWWPRRWLGSLFSGRRCWWLWRRFFHGWRWHGFRFRFQLVFLSRGAASICLRWRL